MSQVSKSEFLENAFSAQKLIEFEQDENLPAIGNEEFCTRLTEGLFDCSIPLLSQRENLHRQFKGKHSVATRTLNFCLLVDLIYEAFAQTAHFHADIAELNLSLKPVILKALISDPKFLHSEHHFLRELLDNYFASAAAWSPSLGSPGKQLFNRFRHLLMSLQSLDGSEKSLPEKIARELETLNKLFDHFKSQEKQLCDNERLHITAKLAARAVDSFLDEAMSNKALPASIIQFLQQPWRRLLLKYSGNSADDSKQRDKLKEFTLQIIATYCDDKADPNAEKSAPNKLANILEMKPTLEKYLAKYPDQDEIADYLSEIEKLSIKILNGQSYPTEIATPLLEENNQIYAKIGKSIMDMSAKLKPGQVIACEVNNSPQRCKIADIYFNETKEFLLTNLIGEKIALKSFVSLGYELVAKTCQLIDSEKLFKKSFIKALEVYLRRYDHARKQSELDRSKQNEIELRKIALEKAKREAEQLRLQKEEMALQFQQEAERQRLQQEEMEKRIKAEMERKFQEETENLRKQNSQLALQLQEEARKNEIHEATLKVDALTIGSWIQMLNKQGELAPCKIGMIYSSNKKIVLVDRSGLRLGEYFPSELVQLILDGKAKILKQENSFEQSMEKVIDSLKR